MTYAANWTNANTAGRVDVGTHWIKLSDVQEMALAVNRRRRLTYQANQTFTIDDDVRSISTLEFRSQLSGLLSAPTGTLGGTPSTPGRMEWLWPVTGSDENKQIVSGSAGAEQVSLFAKLNATGNWSDVDISADDMIRAVYCNELRQCVEWLSRGRWQLPIYFSAGIFSMLPDTPWLGEHIANNGSDELRALGFAILRTGSSPTLGLVDVAVRSESELELTADTNCQLDIYHSLPVVDYVSDLPTWNSYNPPGGLGSGEAVNIGSLTLTADTPATISNSALQAVLQNMVDGSEQNFLVRRSDTGNETINITGQLRVEFDLNSPPN